MKSVSSNTAGFASEKDYQKKMLIDIEFGDRESTMQFDMQFARFQEQNRYHDEKVKFSVLRQVPGFEERMAKYGDTKPFYINDLCYL